MSESLMKFVENFTKNQLISYFLLLWAATFFFSSISGFTWMAAGHTSGIDIIIDGLWNLADLGCAAVLGMLGLKMLKAEQEKEQIN